MGCGCGPNGFDVSRMEMNVRRTNMNQVERVTLNPAVMGGKPCIRGMRVTVGMIIGLLASKRSREEILRAYPYLEDEDFDAALKYAIK